MNRASARLKLTRLHVTLALIRLTRTALGVVATGTYIVPRRFLSKEYAEGRDRLAFNTWRFEPQRWSPNFVADEVRNKAAWRTYAGRAALGAVLGVIVADAKLVLQFFDEIARTAGVTSSWGSAGVAFGAAIIGTGVAEGVGGYLLQQQLASMLDIALEPYQRMKRAFKRSFPRATLLPAAYEQQLKEAFAYATTRRLTSRVDTLSAALIAAIWARPALPYVLAAFAATEVGVLAASKVIEKADAARQRLSSETGSREQALNSPELLASLARGGARRQAHERQLSSIERRGNKAFSRFLRAENRLNLIGQCLYAAMWSPVAITMWKLGIPFPTIAAVMGPVAVGVRGIQYRVRDHGRTREALVIKREAEAAAFLVEALEASERFRTAALDLSEDSTPPSLVIDNAAVVGTVGFENLLGLTDESPTPDVVIPRLVVPGGVVGVIADDSPVIEAVVDAAMGSRPVMGRRGRPSTVMLGNGPLATDLSRVRREDLDAHVIYSGRDQLSTPPALQREALGLSQQEVARFFDELGEPQLSGEARREWTAPSVRSSDQDPRLIEMAWHVGLPLLAAKRRLKEDPNTPRPRLVLLKDPFDGLWPRNQPFVQRLLDEARAQGVTVLVSAQNAPRILEHCDRLLAIETEQSTCVVGPDRVWDERYLVGDVLEDEPSALLHPLGPLRDWLARFPPTEQPFSGRPRLAMDIGPPRPESGRRPYREEFGLDL